jgi:4-hydroxy-tetrahydrodipicolinate synthase
MPFLADGAIDEESLRREVDWALGQGVQGLGLALASEMPRLTESERARVSAVVVEQVEGRLPVVVHASAESARVAIGLARRAEADGAGALMVHPPTFQISGQEEVAAFFEELMAATTVPVFLQDTVFARVDLSMATALAERYPGRVLLKLEVPPTPRLVERVVQATGGRIPVFGGAGGTAFYSELLRGAVGTMPSSMAPALFVEIWTLFRDGELEASRLAFARLLPLLSATHAPGVGLAFFREALVLRGVFQQAYARTPAAALSDTDRSELRMLLDDLELLPVPR